MLMSSNSIRNQSPESSRFAPNHSLNASRRSNSINQESFKCGVGCLYLPGFSKRKSMVQLSRERSVRGDKEDTSDVPNGTEVSRAQDNTITLGENEVSRESTRASVYQTEAMRALSFERFDCGSNMSGIIYNLASEEAGWKSPYYDLPVELIRTVSNDAESPVNTAFLFDYNPKKSMKERRKYILAQSKSLQLISKGDQIARAPSSCPASPDGAKG